jgi:tRNA threonylcarbamoyladenosine biosynthesis protein TsaE
LGSGKTVFIRGFVRGFLKDPEIQVRSPSYVLQHIYGQGFRRVYHMDLYRIFKYEDLIGAGLLEGFEDQEGAVCIEWAERIRDDLPKTKMLYVRFEHIDLDKRRLTVGW